MSSSELNAASVAAVANALEACAGSIETTSSHTWLFPLPGKHTADVSVALDGAWLHLETPLPGRGDGNLPGPRRSLGMLQGNTFLPQGMSYCVGCRSRGTYLVADAPLHDFYSDTEQMLHEVQALFNAFCSVSATSPRKLAAADSRSMNGLHQPLTVDDEAGEAIRALCESTGWAYNERGNGQLAITLDVPGQFCQAYVYLVGESEYRLSTTLETPDQVSRISRYAMASFLLTASRVVRMARAAAMSTKAVSHNAASAKLASEYRWEVAWSHPPTPTQFHCGLSTLSIASRLTRQELLALCDESIAGMYLKLRGCTSQ